MLSAKNSVQCSREALLVSILSGQSLSDGIHLGGLRLFSIVYPDGWTAAVLTFQSSYDEGITWSDVYSGGAEYATAVIANTDDDIDIHRFSSISMIRLRSGRADMPVEQDADRIFTFVLGGN